MDLQELIARGRFLFSNAPERLGVFNLVNGRRTAADVARSLKRLVNNVHRDLKLLSDAGLIQARTGRDGHPTKVKGFTLYEKTPLARTVPATYFPGPTKSLREKPRPKKPKPKSHGRQLQSLPIPTETEILDICQKGEDQIYEFKAAGADVRKITKEIAAMLNTRQGGMVFYGVDDTGKIHGTDVTRQKFDQPLQNSVKNSISPAAIITLSSVSVMGTEVLVVVVPPWNRSDVYQFDERILIRKGTNAFAAKTEEMRKLFLGEPIV
jgi:predicted HTH transcriptional regulator